jgi:hypothetical protein
VSIDSRQRALPLATSLSKPPYVGVKSSLVASDAWIQVAKFKGLLEQWFYYLLTQVKIQFMIAHIMVIHYDRCMLYFQETKALSVPLREILRMSISLGSFYSAVTKSSCITPDEDVLHVAFIYMIQRLSIIDSASATACMASSLKDSNILLTYNDFLLICCVMFAADINQFFSSSKFSTLEGTQMASNLSRQENVILRVEKLARFYLDSSVSSSLLSVDEEYSVHFHNLLKTSPASAGQMPEGAPLQLWDSDRVYMASVLWYARKSGLLVSLPQLEYLFRSLLSASTTLNSGHTPFILAKLPTDAIEAMVHSETLVAVSPIISGQVLVDAASRFRSAGRNDYYSISNEAPESSIVPLICTFPRALFADATNQSVFWRHAYAPYCSFMLLRSSQALETVFLACEELDQQREAPSDRAYNDKGAESITLRSIVELCTAREVFPYLVPPEEGLRLFSFLIEKTEGYDPSCSAPQQHVDILGLYELLFALGQMATELEEMSEEQRTQMHKDSGRSPDERYLRSWNQNKETFSIFSCVRKAWNSFATLLLHLTNEESVMNSIVEPAKTQDVVLRVNTADTSSTEPQLVERLLDSGNAPSESISAEPSLRASQKLWAAHVEFGSDEGFNQKLAALMTNALYTEEQPKWRSDWLASASIDRFVRPVKSGNNELLITNTLDAALLASLLFFPLSHLDYNIVTFYNLFEACHHQTLIVSENQPVDGDFNLMALRMVGFFFILHNRFQIKTGDIYLHLRKTLLSDDTFESLDNHSSHCASSNTIFSIDVVQSGLQDLASQMRIVVNLLNSGSLELLDRSKDALLWDFMLYSTQIHVSTNETAASLGLDSNSVILPVPDINLMSKNVVWWTVDAAYRWALRLLQKTFVDVKLEAHLIARLSRVMCSVSGLVDCEEAKVCEGRDLMSYSSYLIFAVTLLLYAGAYSNWDSDGQNIALYVKMLTEYVSISLSYRFWESGNPTYVSFISQGGLADACDPMLQKSIIASAMRVFDQQYSLPHETHTHHSSSSLVLPPRPPFKFWDGPRCIQFLKTFGILSSVVFVEHRLSDVDLIACAWKAMDATLTLHYSAGKLAVWSSNGITPPLPFKADVDNIAEFIRKFIECVIVSPNSKSITTIPLIPMRCAVLSSLIPILSSNDFHSNILGQPSRTICDFGMRSLEDLLRCGGSRVTETLDMYRPWLAEEFKLLCLSHNIDEVNVLRLPFQLAAKYMSCYGLLKHRTLCKLARASLHPYWRQWREPIFNSSAPPDLAHILNYNTGIVHDKPQTHLLYVEFEEFFVRCAFEMYETWSSSVGRHKVKSPSSIAETIFKNPDAKATLTHYLNELSALINPGIGNATRAHLTPATVNPSHWGTDFLHPFASTLQAISVSRESKGFYRSSASVNAHLGAAREKLGIVLDPGNYSKLEEPPARTFSELGDSSAFRQIANDRDPVVLSAPSPVSRAPFVPSPSAVISPPSSVGKHVSTEPNALPGPALIPFPSISPQRPPPISLDLVSNKLDDAIIRGRDVYLDSILKSRMEASKSVTESSADSTNSLSMKLSIPDRVSNERPIDLAGSSTVEMAKLLEGTKEALWPVFATYCSCGDSLEPGKLSGPNLLTLLSKLNVLTDQTSLSDIGILLHQVSTHSTSKGPVGGGSTDSDESGLESPLLSFEEFLVFLCTYANLRYEGTIVFPDFNEPLDDVSDVSSERERSPQQPIISNNSKLTVTEKRKEDRLHRMNSRRIIDSWTLNWNNIMITSKPFKRLLVECVMPILKKDPVLAFPEDARHRDLFIQIFSLEVLMSIQKQEDSLLRAFNFHRNMDRERVQDYYIKLDVQQDAMETIIRPQYFIIDALERIKIVPQKVSRAEVLEFIEDILPNVSKARDVGRGRQLAEMNYPQWQWVLSIVAVKAVNNALGRSSLAKGSPNKTGQGVRKPLTYPYIGEMFI